MFDGPDHFDLGDIDPPESAAGAIAVLIVLATIFLFCVVL